MAAFFIFRSRRRSMLTLKVMSSGGGEEIYCGLNVGFNPDQQSIAVSGMDQAIFLKEGDVAYVINQNGKTVSRYEYVVCQ